MKRIPVELIGGPWDGEVGDASPESLRMDAVVMHRCPRHGDNPICECFDDDEWYIYSQKPTREDGSPNPFRFRVLDEQR